MKPALSIPDLQTSDLGSQSEPLAFNCRQPLGVGRRGRDVNKLQYVKDTVAAFPHDVITVPTHALKAPLFASYDRWCSN